MVVARSPHPLIEVFDGEIFGFGTGSGHRFVVGRWTRSPFGPFADVMHEDPDGRRTLLAPTEQVAEQKLTIAKRRAATNTGRENSMIQDVRQGRLFEVEAIVGNTVRRARTLDVKMPLTEMPLTEIPLTEIPFNEVPLTEMPLTEIPLTEIPLSPTSD